jgi:hypothetical protein
MAAPFRSFAWILNRRMVNKGSMAGELLLQIDDYSVPKVSKPKRGTALWRLRSKTGNVASAMGAMSKRKGGRVEREIVQLHRDIGVHSQRFAVPHPW